MASLPEQVREHFKTCLLAMPQIPGVLGKVFRAREDLVGDEEGEDGVINIKAGDEAAQPISDRADRYEAMVELDIHVRVGQDQAWETKADTIAVAAHDRLMAYASWPAWVSSIRHVGVDRGADRGNRTPGRETHRYAVRFPRDARALDKAPPLHP